MKKSITSLADYAMNNPAILKEIVANPDKVASKFNLNAIDAKSLRNNDFGIPTEANRSLRASKHDDAYLS
ncbi:MAG: hypothetical protein KGJ58_04440 [Patescibacteria group bacterium]|nr:hypothetical protein [Patescibacteria group bacterium]MDE2218661.1 hypothetical protein [Patescibacteria group bacterium]